MKITIYSTNISANNAVRLRSKNCKKFTKSVYSYSSIKLGNNIKSIINFNPVVVNLHDMTINRPSIFSNNSKKITNNKIIIPYSPDLEGEYEIEKVNEDSFKLLKL